MVKIYIIGKLGADAQEKKWEGKRIITFSIAHNDRFKDKNGEKQERTTWYKCEYHGSNKILEYLKRGTSVYVEGVPNVKMYKDKNSGEMQLYNGVTVFTIQLIGN